MFICQYSEGSWKLPKITKYEPFEVDPSLRVFHYGQAVFEGMKAYKDEEGRTWMFRPMENIKRFNISSKRLDIPSFPEDVFLSALEKLIALEKDWIQKGEGNALYIRPFVIATDNNIMANSSSAYKFMIICSPVQSYYSGSIKVKIEQHYSRSANGGYGYAKASGNYAGQFYPTKIAIEEGFQQIIWTDSEQHEYLEEAGTMNIFFRIHNTLITSPTSDRILDGITRNSIIALAKQKGIKAEERAIKLQEILEAHHKGTLKEIFGTGTAATITPVSTFGYQSNTYDLQEQQDSYANMFKQLITDIQYNRAEDSFGWRYLVK
ncbi:branched-chain-amino-acid aminotransferase [Elysia marginata]|uniref:Branched-chain-amino-acid aminotransferase n=1 Tax=Elysia marginata TaxID=1093978 RepID=A0AAV4FQ79_9GAST|nr:branched-chain-amino-acid aminotransferase [Elysia marginata]